MTLPPTPTPSDTSTPNIPNITFSPTSSQNDTKTPNITFSPTPVSDNQDADDEYTGTLGPTAAYSTSTWPVDIDTSLVSMAWRSLADMPAKAGEVASAYCRGSLIVVGAGASPVAYNSSSGEWRNIRVPPAQGSHHAAVCLRGRFYLVGGFKAEGKLQIYDPVADVWVVGADMPMAVGSTAAAALGGRIFACGGIDKNAHKKQDPTTSACGRFQLHFTGEHTSVEKSSRSTGSRDSEGVSTTATIE